MVDKKIIWESQHLEINPHDGSMFDPSETKINHMFEEVDDYDEAVVVPKHLTATPWGVWNIDDAMHPMKQFKLWMGHTNFDLTEDIILAISEIPGVEILKPITRYRFIIGVGAAFNVRTTQLAIELVICEKNSYENETDRIYNKEINTTVKTLIDFLKNDDKIDRWALFVFPNGSIEHSTSLSDSFQEDLERFEEAKVNTNGILLKSE
jgi:hypothetical protein